MTNGNRGGRFKMGGPRHVRPPAEAPSAPVKRARKKRVLFVCIGNSCRSQMAEAFARAYGSDVMEVVSAGLNPAMIVAPLTKQVLGERNLKIEDHFPKALLAVTNEPFDVIVNMSGQKIPDAANLDGPRMREWRVEDPIGQKESVYRAVAQQIEGLVMSLILELRSER